VARRRSGGGAECAAYALFVDAETPELPSSLVGLLRHFRDLRDGTHGGVASRGEKEASFARTVELLDPVARQALGEINDHLLASTGSVEQTGLQRDADGSWASWTLTWLEQQRADVPPIELRAHFGAGFHHPHLRGGTVENWPLNVFSDEDAAAQLPVLRAIAAADLHNLVFRANYRIVPRMTGEDAE
jgi:hypothetical protein